MDDRVRLETVAPPDVERRVTVLTGVIVIFLGKLRFLYFERS